MQVLEKMDIPCKALVDLDFAFQGAIKQSLIDAGNTAITECKKIFATNSDITLNDGLPTKKGKLNAAEAFEWLAKQENAKQHIQALHDTLKEQNIWLWKLGAIEPYLGLDTNSKSEAAWSSVKQVIDDNGVSAVIKDDELTEMLEWLCER